MPLPASLSSSASSLSLQLAAMVSSSADLSRKAYLDSDRDYMELSQHADEKDGLPGTEDDLEDGSAGGSSDEDDDDVDAPAEAAASSSWLGQHSALAAVCLALAWSLTLFLALTLGWTVYSLGSAAVLEAWQRQWAATLSSPQPQQPPPPPASLTAAALPPSAAAEDLLALVAPGTSPFNSSVCLHGYGGRFGNHVYMLMMAVKVAFHQRLQLHLAPCPYASVLSQHQRFTKPCPVHTASYSLGDAQWNGGERWWDDDVRSRVSNPALFHLNIGGYFQYPSWVYASHKREIRQFFAPQGALLSLLQKLKAAVLSRHCARSLVVAMHVRTGDFATADKVDYKVLNPVQIPVAWYLDFLRRFTANSSSLRQAKQWQDRDCPAPLQLPYQDRVTVYLATEGDMPGQALRAAGYEVVTVQDAVAASLEPYTALSPGDMGFFPDWWLLSQFRVLVAGHSSFSLTASMQSPYYDSGEALFFWPDAATLRIAPLDPFNFSYDFAAFSRGGKRIIT